MKIRVRTIANYYVKTVHKNIIDKNLNKYVRRKNKYVLNHDQFGFRKCMFRKAMFALGLI